MRLFSRKPKPFALDPLLGDPDALALRTALTGRDWPAARRILEAAAADPDRRGFLMSAAADTPGLQEWIGQAVDAEPESTLALLVQGCHAVYWAWEARGAATANLTSQEQFHLFSRRSKIAEDCLDEVVERTPGDPTAWAYLVTLARARQLGREETERRFAEAVAAAPHQRGAHNSMLQYLCGKWGGSDEEMFAFARKSFAAAPDGSPLGELVADAHIEKWLSDDEATDAYFAGSEVLDELRSAADRSIFHPSFQLTPATAGVPNSFAFVFALAEDRSYGSRTFALLGEMVTEDPWYYAPGTPGEAFTRLKGYVA